MKSCSVVLLAAVCGILWGCLIRQSESVALATESKLPAIRIEKAEYDDGRGGIEPIGDPPPILPKITFQMKIVRHGCMELIVTEDSLSVVKQNLTEEHCVGDLRSFVPSDGSAGERFPGEGHSTFFRLTIDEDPPFDLARLNRWRVENPLLVSVLPPRP